MAVVSVRRKPSGAVPASGNGHTGTYRNGSHSNGDQQFHLEETPTVAGRRMFLEEAARIPGIEVIRGEGPIDGCTITVVVPAIRSKEADAVFDLEGRVRRLHRGCRLGIRIEDLEP